MEAPPQPATTRRDAAVARRGTGCTTVSATPPAHDPVPAFRKAFRALRDALAKFNASIRVRYPKSSPLARAMARNTSGLLGGAPFLVQDLKFAIEDAIFAQWGTVCRLSEDIADILGAADVWAGLARVCGWGRRYQRQSISIIERGVFDLIRARSDALYDLCAELLGPGDGTEQLKRQKLRCQFKRKLDAMEHALKRARKDPEPTYKLLLMLRRAVPPDCATMIVAYVA